MTKPRVPVSDDLQSAYQAHTLAQLLYARIVAAPSWTPAPQALIPPVIH
jgi:hypothetical protein